MCPELRASPDWRRRAAHRPAAAGRPEPGAGAAAPSRRAVPDWRAGLDQADPRCRACRLRRPGPAGDMGDRRAAAPGARSAAGTGGRPWARHSANRRSPRCPVRCSARSPVHSRRPGWAGAARSVPAAGAGVSGPAAGAAFPQVAAAAGRTHRRQHRPSLGPVHSRRPAGRRGDRPGVYAWAGRRHRGPGRCRHVPPGTSWTVLPSRAAGHAVPHECRSGEIPCRT